MQHRQAPDVLAKTCGRLGESLGGGGCQMIEGRALHSKDLTFLLLFSLLTVHVGEASQKPARQRVKPEASTNEIRAQLLNADTNPTLRFPVARMGHMNSTLSFGWLDISRTSIRYRVEQPPEKSQDSFEVTRAQMRGLDFQGLFLEFSNPKMQRIFFLPPNEWDSFRRGFSIVSAAEGGAEMTRAIAQAIENFDLALSLARPPAPAPPAVTERPETPAAPPSKPAVQARAPSIVLVEPAGAGDERAVEADNSPLVIRGAVMDAGGIPVVTINGAPANLRPQSTQTAEFWSDPLPLQVGENRFQISASNSARVGAHLIVVVNYAPKAAPAHPRALDKESILGLLKGGVPATHVAALIKERGVKFRPTDDDLKAIRAEGGSDEVVQAIQQAEMPSP